MLYCIQFILVKLGLSEKIAIKMVLFWFANESNALFWCASICSKDGH